MRSVTEAVDPALREELSGEIVCCKGQKDVGIRCEANASPRAGVRRP